MFFLFTNKQQLEWFYISLCFNLFFSLCSWDNPSPDAPCYTWRKAIVSVGTDPFSVSARIPVFNQSCSYCSLCYPSVQLPPVLWVHWQNALSSVSVIRLNLAAFHPWMLATSVPFHSFLTDLRRLWLKYFWLYLMVLITISTWTITNLNIPWPSKYDGTVLMPVDQLLTNLNNAFGLWCVKHFVVFQVDNDWLHFNTYLIAGEMTCLTLDNDTWLYVH